MCRVWKASSAPCCAIRKPRNGSASRAKAGEYAFRDPALWTSPQLLSRCVGLPLLINHPEGEVLDGTELALRNCGVTIHSFIRDGEPWAIGRIIDADVGEALTHMPFDTS